MKYILFFLCWLFAGEVRGDWGVDYLALQGYSGSECKLALKVFEGLPQANMQILWESFGSRIGCIDKFLDLPQKEKLLVIYATNGTCDRSGRTCTKRDKPRSFRKRAKKISSFIVPRIEKSKFAVITTLEDDKSNKEERHKAKILKKILPAKVLIGRNPNSEKANFDSSFDFVELHSKNAKFPSQGLCFFSNDGADVSFFGERGETDNRISLSSLPSYFRRAKENHCHKFVWWNSQGIKRGKFIKPFNRDFDIRSEHVFLVNKFLRDF